MVPALEAAAAADFAKNAASDFVVKVFRMSETFTLELTKDQKDTLLQGLRFVRSSIMLDINDNPTDESEEDRRARLRKVTELTEQVNRAPVMAH